MYLSHNICKICFKCAFLSTDNTRIELEKKKAKSNLCLMNNNIFNYFDELKIHSLDEEG